MDIRKYLENRKDITPVNQQYIELHSKSLEAMATGLMLPNSQKKHVMACAKHLDFWLQSQSYSIKDINAELLLAYLESLKTTPVSSRRKNPNFEDSNEKIGYSIASQNARKFALYRLLEEFFDPLLQKQLKSILGRNFASKQSANIKASDYITKEKVQQLIAFCFSHKRSRTKILTGWLIHILFTTGCRFSEIANLRLSDIQFEDDRAMLSIHGKGSKQRFVYAKKSDIIDIQNKFQPKIWLFETSRQNKIDQGSSFKRMNLISKEVLGKEIGHHTLRHSRAMNMIHDEGKDIKTVSKYLGHSSTATTIEFYTHPVITPEDFI